MWFLLPQVLWELAITLTNFLKITFKPLFPQISTPYHSHHISLSLSTPSFSSDLLQPNWLLPFSPLLFFKSLSFHFPLTPPPCQGTEFQVPYCSSCELLKALICPARNSTGDLQAHVGVATHKNLHHGPSKLFQLNRLINHQSFLKVMDSHRNCSMREKNNFNMVKKIPQTTSKDKKKLENICKIHDNFFNVHNYF